MPPGTGDLRLETYHYSGETLGREVGAKGVLCVVAKRLGGVKSATSRFVKPVHFDGPAGRLEGLWDDPGRGLAPAVIGHPHPAHGGSMHSTVVYTVFRVLHDAG